MSDRQGEHEKEVSRKRIKYLISEYAGGSQQEFADATGLKKANVSHYVNGTHAPGNILAAKIARRYGLNPLWVMGFDVPSKLKSDADKFGEYAEAFNATHKPVMLSDDETNLIKKYRMADDRGKEAINYVAEMESRRNRQDLAPVAAHNESDTFTDEQRAKIKEFIDFASKDK